MLVKSKRLKYGIHIDTYIYTDTHAYTHICIWYMHLPATVAHSRNIWCSTKTLLLCEDADHLCAWQLASMYAWMYVCACAVSIIKTSYATALHTNSISGASLLNACARVVFSGDAQLIHFGYHIFWLKTDHALIDMHSHTRSTHTHIYGSAVRQRC